MPLTLYGFWRSLASYRVRTALAMKGVDAEQVSINVLQGKQHAADYRSINPQGVVPALVVDGGSPLFQSMAIMEYLEETHPRPPLLPADPRGRARVRGLAQIVVSDGHPLVVPRIRGYLEKEMHQDERQGTSGSRTGPGKRCKPWKGTWPGNLKPAASATATRLPSRISALHRKSSAPSSSMSIPPAFRRSCAYSQNA